MSGEPKGATLVPTWISIHRRPLVWLVLGAVAVTTSVAMVLGLATHPGAQPFATEHPIVFVGSALVVAAYGLVFGLLVLRVPSNAVGWVFGLFALVAAISNLTWAYISYATETVPPRLTGVEVALVVGAVTVPLWPFLVMALIVLFPDGRPLTNAWGRLVIAGGILALVAALAIVLAAGPLPVWAMGSPLALGGGPGEVSAGLARLSLIALVVLDLVAVWSLQVRYRESDEVGRLQLKWLVHAGLVFASCALTFLLVTEVAHGTSSAASTAAWLLLCVGALDVPLAALLAILHYRLYDIETIIDRTLVYGGLTAILAGIYAAAVRLFNWLFEEFTGESSDAALVLTTLVLATSLTPIKTWLEGRVAARWKTIPDPAAHSADGPLDAHEERIARRAASIVIGQLGGPSQTGVATPSDVDPTLRPPEKQTVGS
jgi:two-component system NarL family sensor kinase